jgi:hypothetical protein
LVTYPSGSEGTAFRIPELVMFGTFIGKLPWRE